MYLKLLKFMAIVFLFISVVFPFEVIAKPNTKNIENIHVRKHHWWWGYTPRNSLYLGMWTYHYMMTRPFKDRNWKNQLIGFNYHSLFIGTIKNSYSERGYIVALRRDFYQKQVGHFYFNAGYMLGLVSGYKDGQMSSITKYTPVIPIPQIFWDMSYKRIAIEIAMIPSVASVGFKILL